MTGITIKLALNPGNTNAKTANPGTKSVVKQRVKTLDTQRKVPRVIKLRGKIRRLITGLIRRSTKVNASEARRRILRLLPQ